MNLLLDALTNPCIIACLSAWVVAQTVKTVIHAFTYKKLDFHRLLGDGGMPSGHTATVTALAAMCGLTEGFDSGVFAVAAILTVVVCRDAVGVRRETEKQAKMLNGLLDTLQEESPDRTLPKERLNTFIGHTPLQIAAGALIGIAVAVGLYFLMN